MKLFYVIAISLVLTFMHVQTSTAQQPSYIFSNYVSKTRPYEELVDDIVVPGFTQAVYDLSALDGQTFHFFGIPCVLGTDAKISLGEGGFLALTLPNGFGFIDGLLMDVAPIDETSRVSYSITGEPGSYLLKYQYKNYSIASGPADNFFNLQMWVYQSTGVVEVHYGPSSASNADAYTTEMGPNAGAIRIDATYAVMEKLWCTGDPDSPTIDSSATQQLPTLVGLPVDGTIYAFTPRAVVAGIDDDAFANAASSSANGASGVLPPQPGEAVTIYNVLGVECREPLSPGYYLMHIVDASGKGRSRGFVK